MPWKNRKGRICFTRKTHLENLKETTFFFPLNLSQPLLFLIFNALLGKVHIKFCTIFAQFGKYICPTTSNSPAMVCLRDRCCTMLKWNTDLFPVRKWPPTAKWSPILHIQNILITILIFKDLFDFLPPTKYRISDSINVSCCIFGFFYHLASRTVQHDHLHSGCLSLLSRLQTPPRTPITFSSLF